MGITRYILLRPITMDGKIVPKDETVTGEQLEQLDYVSVAYLLNHGWIEVINEIQTDHP